MVPQITNQLRPESPVTTADNQDGVVTVIEPGSGWQSISLAELWQFRELVYFLIWRDVKVRYRQTLLGAAWAILQPVLLMIVFTVVFRSFGGGPSSDVPYPLFAFTGLVAWSLFATAVSNAAQSVVNAERLVTKIYFPRLVLPVAAVAAGLVDFAATCLVLVGLMLYYHHSASWTLVYAPFAVGLLILAALGVGGGLAALNVRYRDVRYALPFCIQLWLFATPSIYLEPPATIPAAAMHSENSAGEDPSWLALNPMDGLVAMFRATVIGGPVPWSRAIYSAFAIVVMACVGIYYFCRVEASFADAI